MNLKLDIIAANRKSIAKLISALNEEQLNKIPSGFNNNLVWHFLHLIATFESLSYKNSGLPMQVSEDFILSYKGGTKPETIISKETIDKHLIIFEEQPVRLLNDRQNGVFENYNEFPTRLGNTVKTINDALDFIVFHEATHFGYMLAQRRLLINNQ